MTADTKDRLDHVLTSSDPWWELSKLAESPPLDLVPELRAKLGQLSSAQLVRSAQLLERLGERGVDLLLEILGRDEKSSVAALRGLAREGTPLTRALLLPFLRSGNPELARAAMAAASFVDDPALVDDVFAHWDTTLRVDVARFLGVRRITTHTHELVALLSGRYGEPNRKDWEHVAVALETMADPTCVPQVRRLMADAPSDKVWALAQVLRAASGEDRLADWIKQGFSYDHEALRRAWLSESTTNPPGIVRVERVSDTQVEILLQGTGRIRLGYPHIGVTSSWPRWDRALYCGDEVLYHANSDCGTCETFLLRAGAQRPRVDAERVRHALRDVSGLDEALLSALEPALTPLASGRMFITLADVALQRVGHGARSDSWYATRATHRKSDEEDADEAAEAYAIDTGTAHYQGKHLLSMSPPTAITVLPTQRIDTFDEAVIARRLEALRNHDHPAVLAVGWYEQRDIQGAYPEAVLQLIVLDGHHTLEASVRAGVATRVIAVCPYAFGNVEGPRTLLAGLQAG